MFPMNEPYLEDAKENLVSIDLCLEEYAQQNLIYLQAKLILTEMIALKSAYFSQIWTAEDKIIQE